MVHEIDNGLREGHENSSVTLGQERETPQLHSNGGDIINNGSTRTASHRDSIDTIEEVETDRIVPKILKSSVSTIPGLMIPVARDKRRGLLARFALIPEVEDPKCYPRRTKWSITFFVALAAAAGPMASAIFMRESTNSESLRI